ncbi:transcription termination factor MTERF2, chloroplastic-like [Durio zibethinus]|uniref:Transcription termination factor MTERF2, chloroplastic-like n=1 Tax=Durio zibethinus TaxID=66656 RepID=A0A6P5YLH9_DURZI|nr:transcription termination factor MTERF2, chloroplastic-like [Durio zibethinus]
MIGSMFCSFCKTQIYIRGGISRISPTSQCLIFLQNHPMIPLAARYVSRIASNEQSFTASYLINSYGFSPESALSVSKRVHFETPQKPDSVISFFKNHGFSQTQIRNLIQRRPKLLLSNPDKTLLPKFQFFYSKGISSSDLARILSSNPLVLANDLDKRIIPNFNFIKDLTHCADDKVFLAYKHWSGILTRNLQSVFACNLAILREIGVPESILLAELIVHPSIFAHNHDKFRRTTEEVKKLGFTPSKQLFLVALQALMQNSKSTWERKSNAFKKWGWSDEDIFSAFEKYPRCMIFSEHKVASTMNFYVNTMGCKSSYIANCPVLLSYSLERRIIPRYSVLQALLSKGLIEKFSVHSIGCTEKKFLQRFVTPYEDPYLLKLYKEKLGLSE